MYHFNLIVILTGFLFTKHNKIYVILFTSITNQSASYYFFFVVLLFLKSSCHWQRIGTHRVRSLISFFKHIRQINKFMKVQSKVQVHADDLHNSGSSMIWDQAHPCIPPTTANGIYHLFSPVIQLCVYVPS